MSRFVPRRSAFVAALLALGLGAAACGGSDDTREESADGLTKVTRIMAAPNPVVSNAYFLEVPERLGYFEEEGIEVEVEYASSANDAARLVVTGRGDFSQAGSSTFWSVGAQDSDLRVVGLTPNNGFFTVVAEDSDVTSFEELEGATIGAAAANGPEQMYSEAALRSAGVDLDTIEWLTVGSGAQAAEALSNGDVDAYASYNGQLQVVGTFVDGGVRKLPSVLDDMAGFSGFMTSADVIEEDRDLVVRYMRAIYKGFAFTEANPEAAIAIYYEAHADQKPDVANDEELFAQILPVVADGWTAGGVPGPDGTYGHLDMELVQESFDFLYDQGLVEGEKPELEELLALDISEEASDFDVAAVKQQADEWFD